MGGPWLDHEKGKLTAFHHSVLEGQASTLCGKIGKGADICAAVYGILRIGCAGDFGIAEFAGNYGVKGETV